jgi:hypothetical protein
MSATHWVAYIVVSLIALSVVVYLYRRREPPGRGRTLLAALRGIAIAILLLVLFDPRIAQPIDRSAARRAPVLLDASLSMLLPSRDSTPQWRDAVAAATKRAGTGGIVVFGDVPASISADSLAHAQPVASHSRLLPALQAAAEAGATDITVISDGNLEDADAVTRWLPRLGVNVEWVKPNAATHDLALTEMDAPSWVEAGKSADITIGVQANGAVRDSVTVTLRQDNAVLATQRIATPAPGRTVTLKMSAKPRAPAGGGYVRIEARIDAADGFTDDDVRNVYVYVSDEPAGIVLVSLAPDWEPRFLLPTLARAVALPARGYLRVSGGKWVRVGEGLQAGANVDDAVVQRAVANADLVIVHNARADAPAWVIDALRNARRMIVFPSDIAGPLPLPVHPGIPAADDWFLSADIPPSPVSPLLTGLHVDDIPPIESLAAAAVPSGAWVPMLATRGRRGVPGPLAIAGETDGRRWAVALGTGYWHWAFQGGAAADAYNRLWSSIGGWLMRDAQSADIAAVRPVQRAVFRGEPVKWVTRAGPLDSVRVAVMPGGQSFTIRAEHDTATMSVMPPGTYRFNATAFERGTTMTSSGEFTVETYSPEFARPSSAIPAGGNSNSVRALRADMRNTKPLHASWIPYALLVLLLAAEWILRRRWGLR